MIEPLLWMLAGFILAVITLLALSLCWAAKKGDEAMEDIWRDHGKADRERMIRETMADFDEPHPLMDCPDCGKFRNMGHRCDEAPTEKLQ